MPPPGETIAELFAEMDRLSGKCREDHDEVLRQQRASLQTIPEVRDALAAFETALRDIERAFARTEQDLTATLQEATDDATRKQQDDDDAANAAAVEARQAAEAEQVDKLQACRDEADAERRAADNLPLDQRLAARQAAEEKRRRAEAQIERETRRKVAESFRTFESTRNKNQDVMFATIERARRDDTEKRGDATTARNRATEDAQTALSDAMAANPVAAAIQEAFLGRLRAVDDECERKKQDLLDRIKRAGAGAGG